MKYAIFGATGTVGRALAAEFAAEAQPFRVVGRSEAKLREQFSRCGNLVEICEADLSNPSAAAAAAKNIDTIFYTVGVPYTNFALHPQLTRVALTAANASGVLRFIHVATVYPYGLPQQEYVDESHPREPHTFKGRMRKEQEDMVLSAHGQGSLATTILRAPDFYGPDSELSYARSIFDAALKGGRATVIGPVDTPHEFVFVPDLAKTLLALSRKPEAYGTAWNLAGAGAIPVRRFAELVFAAAGKPAKLRIVNKILLRLIGIFSPFMREVAEMNYLWTNPVLLDDTRLKRLLPELRKTPYEHGIRITLDAMRAHSGT